MTYTFKIPAVEHQMLLAIAKRHRQQPLNTLLSLIQQAYGQR